MSLRGAAVVGAALAAAALASAAAPTKAGWAKAANEICATQNAQIQALPKVTAKTVVGDLRATVKIAAAGYARMAALPRPAGEGSLIASMLADGAQQDKIVTGQVIPALAAGRSAAAPIDQVDKLGNAYNTAAKKLGATICALNPVPSGGATALA